MQFFFLLPNRSQPYLKVVQGERNKKKNCIFLFIALALHYLCTMKSIIESLAKEEQAILIVALFLLIYVGIMINVMVREYRTYLDDYPMCHFSLGDFIRRGRFYICLILGVVFITFVCLVVSLMAISIQ